VNIKLWRGNGIGALDLFTDDIKLVKACVYHNLEDKVSLEREGSDMILKDSAERLNMAAELENMDQA